MRGGAVRPPDGAGAGRCDRAARLARRGHRGRAAAVPARCAAGPGSGAATARRAVRRTSYAAVAPRERIGSPRPAPDPARGARGGRGRRGGDRGRVLLDPRARARPARGRPRLRPPHRARRGGGRPPCGRPRAHPRAVGDRRGARVRAPLHPRGRGGRRGPGDRRRVLHRHRRRRRPARRPGPRSHRRAPGTPGPRHRLRRRLLPPPVRRLPPARATAARSRASPRAPATYWRCSASSP